MTVFTFSAMWFVAAAMFLFLALSLRGRPLVSLVGQCGVLVIVVSDALVRAAPPAFVGYVVTRPFVLLVLSTVLVLLTLRLQRRSAMLEDRRLHASAGEAWRVAAQAELAERAAELRSRVLPILSRLAGEERVTEDDRRACRRIEGELRDEVRAGVLARSDPLRRAASAARERGVDVVLLDDGEGGRSPIRRPTRSPAGWRRRSRPRGSVSSGGCSPPAARRRRP